MSGAPDDPDDEPTIALPAGGPTPPEAPSPWGDDERTRIIMPGEGGLEADDGDERTRIHVAPPSAAAVEPPPGGPAADPGVWDRAAGAAAPLPSSELVPGTVLGNYRVGARMGQGGLGAIYAGVNVHNPAERVAIKTILPNPALGERFGKMLLDEANALMRVRHDAVVPYRTYGRVSEDGAYYLVLEFIDGEPLSDFYHRRKLTLKEVIALGRRLAAGLEAAHQEGLVHRDISPDNVLLPQSQLDRAVLIDFGIARVGDEDIPEHQFAGKLSYAAPEQFQAGGRIGPFTDVYSLALLLAAAARGEPVPMGRTVGGAEEARRGVPDLPGVPEPLAVVLRRMLEPHTPDRPQSMSAVIALLDEAERAADRAPPPVPPAATAAPAAKPAVAPRPGAAVKPGVTITNPGEAPKGGVRRAARPPADAKPKRRGGGGGLLSLLLALLIGGGAAGALMYFEEDIFGKRRASPPKWVKTTLSTDGETKPPGSDTKPPGGDTKPPEGDTKPPPPPPPPPEKTRTEVLAETLTAFRTGLAAVPCALSHVDGKDTGSAYQVSIKGVRADEAALRRAADAIAHATGAEITLAGQAFQPSLCAVADQLKALELPYGAALLTRPAPRPGKDRAMTFSAAVPPGTTQYVIAEIDAAGRIAAVLDLSTPQSRAALGGAVTARGDVYDLVLTPASPAANTEQSMLVAVAASAPLARLPAPGMTLADWVAAIKPGAAFTLDAMPRDGVPAGAGQTPPPPPPPPPETPEQKSAKAKAAIEARLGTVACSLVRVAPASGGAALSFTVGGVWGDEAALRSAAADAASTAAATVNVAGDAVDPQLCGALDTLKKTAPGLGPAMLAAPVSPNAPDRTTTILVTPRPDAPALYLVEADRTGKVSGLADLSSPEAIAKAKAAGTVEEAGGGLKVKLAPANGTANTEATLILAASVPAPAALLLPAQPVALDAWAAEAARAKASLDAAERLGVPAAAPPPPPPPPPTGDFTPAIRDRFAAVDCSIITLAGPAGQPREAGVLGLWGKASAVQKAADDSAAEAGFAFVLKGEAVQARHCAVLNGVKPWYAPGAAAAVAKPKPTGRPDRTSEAALTLDPAFAHFFVLLIDAGGQVRGLVELTDPAKLAQRVAQGMVVDDGGGRFRLVLPPYSKAADSPSQMLVAVLSADPLPQEAFGFAGVAGLKGWLAALGQASSATKLRVEAAEYVQAPP